MTDRKPPRLANWLLRYFGLASHEPLIGDIAEEFHSGRSAGWYWRQTLWAIWTAVKAAKSLFVPQLIGWSVQLLIVEILVARHVHFGLCGSLLLVPAYAALFIAWVVVAVLLELGQWWDVLFKSFLGNAFGNWLDSFLQRNRLSDSRLARLSYSRRRSGLSGVQRLLALPGRVPGCEVP